MTWTLDMDAELGLYTINDAQGEFACVTAVRDDHSRARLIATAPEQHALIIEFIEWVDRFTGTLPEPQSDAMFDLYRRARSLYQRVDPDRHDAARAAIAKATGADQ